MGNASSAPQQPSNSAQFQAPIFRLPHDVRLMIYGMVLSTSEDILNPHELLTANPGAQYYRRRLSGLTPALLRTCWLIYEEATPVLYQNLFIFTNPLHICHFFETWTSADGKEVALWRPQRMTRIRLKFERQPFYARANAARRKEVAELWTIEEVGIFNFVELKKALLVIQPDYTPMSEAGCWFPSLRHLELDFQPLAFPRSARFPRLLLHGIKNTGLYDWKLASLTVQGLPHHQHVAEIFEQALLKKPAARRLTNVRDRRI
ncbi:hypothetical protein MMC30_000354 [Trapelia coarctata]|nr:hypothetical protein [Trapelia coarctata]